MIRAVMAGVFVLLAACDQIGGGKDSHRSAAAAPFPQADRPVAPIVSTRWSSEEARDRVNEAEDIMDRAGIRSGMTVADIGAGEGYYTVRLARRVGAKGRVLAEDIMPEVIEALSRRITREKWDNVSLKLGAPEDPKLPENSFDRIMMVHMYHEIAEPYAFLWHLSPALKKDGELIVVDADRPTDQHGAPPRLLACELAAMGFRMEQLIPKPTAGGYLARFRRIAARPDPASIVPCAFHG
ncbi:MULTISPECIES: class I SAM-dependent methyltransferase [Sphingobium]|uniref:Ubiquinone/menaquinone biosynthesis methyltransferase n=2 Tax=Sphingobium cupriresistens TaxID=1132417 RepID=A0A0J7Y0U3_9SPHN|nr:MULTISPECIES: methyltransferase domain-containing protein [Sphingobium]KMS57008.1 ubiquinone/menaquinone biosynthesis methyltransferase [Sphingobium cupriresistens LL01]RYM14244.1 methyltransferase domain-containing protein [Sphingobium cupriresistens]WCP13968.1 2-methoxy-6-polyprenyl-1,4-benzoquinol methylase, mitochondrial [Sphingobium sp. AntQ-1]